MSLTALRHAAGLMNRLRTVTMAPRARRLMVRLPFAQEPRHRGLQRRQMKPHPPSG